MFLPRFYDNLDKYLEPNKVLVIFGPRRAGKTTILKKYIASTKLKYRFETGEDIRVQEVLDSSDLSKIKQFVEGFELLVIDEAQSVTNIGAGLKLIVDHVPGIRVIATGSSSFDLARNIGEPLTGRKRTLNLYPFSCLELREHMNLFDISNNLPQMLVYGMYPEVIVADAISKKRTAIEEIANSYLFKDILSLDGVRKAKTVIDLTKLLAFQIGNEVSLNELSRYLSVNIKTVERYLDLLEKSFVIIPVFSFARNQRNEIKGRRKYYFYDTGVRNALISQFNDLENRSDVGALWENFMFMERLKKRSYNNIYANNYFWRTYDQKEIDLVEERDGKFFGYEMKWGQKRVKSPKTWLESYPNSEYSVITPENYLDFIL